MENEFFDQAAEAFRQSELCYRLLIASAVGAKGFSHKKLIAAKEAGQAATGYRDKTSGRQITHYLQKARMSTSGLGEKSRTIKAFGISTARSYTGLAFELAERLPKEKLPKGHTNEEKLRRLFVRALHEYDAMREATSGADAASGPPPELTKKIGRRWQLQNVFRCIWERRPVTTIAELRKNVLKKNGKKLPVATIKRYVRHLVVIFLSDNLIDVDGDYITLTIAEK